MSNFRKFHVPQLVRKKNPSNDGIPRFDCDKLVVKDRIGQGAFGDVFTVDYQAPGKETVETVIIKKMLNVMDEQEKKLFSKEVALLNGLVHRNIVKLMSVCYEPFAMMLEYVYFDFNLFGQDVRVSALSDLLVKIDENNCEGFHDLVNHAATEMIDGLAWIAHRDLKAANILVSNQHYSSLSDAEEFEQAFKLRPIACKLTDFGESRSTFIQTQALFTSKTTNIDRGTVVYMAPELLVREKLIPHASIADLILADLWALGMIVFIMINPSLKCPFLLDIRSVGGVTSQEELKTFITSQLQSEKRPMQDAKYDIYRATVWCELEKVYRGCTNFNRQQRLSLEEAGRTLARSKERFSRDLQVINLGLSQATALEQFDQKLAAKLGARNEGISQVPSMPPVNDGTNACAFISVDVAARILHESVRNADFFTDLPKDVEHTIWCLPEKINLHRDIGKMYDALEAYEILRQQEVIETSLAFSEELPFAEGVFSYEGREKLLSKLCALGDDSFVSVFTSVPFVLTIGCHNGRPYVIDTHPNAEPTGNGNGLILVGRENTAEVWLSVCVWIWQRLNHGGVDPTTAQSLAVVTLDTW